MNGNKGEAIHEDTLYDKAMDIVHWTCSVVPFCFVQFELSSMTDRDGAVTYDK